MTTRKRLTAAVAVSLLTAALLWVVLPASAHTVDDCARVRATVADNELVLTAAEHAGGLSSADRTWIARARAINAAALRHCPVGGPSPAPSSPSPSPAPSTPPLADWPNASNTGTPPGWAPTTARATDLTVTTPGAVVEDIRFVNADLIINAPNVTVRRVEMQGGRIVNDPGATCSTGTVIEDVSLIRAPGQTTRATDPPAVGTGSYTARRVKIDGLPEGFRVGGKSTGCGPVSIEDSYVHIRYPDVCGDWHGDGVQGYDGPAVTVTHSTMWLEESGSCGGTAPFFYPAGQGNTSATVNGLIVRGGGYAFRLTTGGSVQGLRVVDGSWGFGPIEVDCGAVSPWQADVVTVDAAWNPTVVRSQPCNT